MSVGESMSRVGSVMRPPDEDGRVGWAFDGIEFFLVRREFGAWVDRRDGRAVQGSPVINELIEDTWMDARRTCSLDEPVMLNQLIRCVTRHPHLFTAIQYDPPLCPSCGSSALYADENWQMWCDDCGATAFPGGRI